MGLFDKVGKFVTGQRDADPTSGYVDVPWWVRDYAGAAVGSAAGPVGTVAGALGAKEVVAVRDDVKPQPGEGFEQWKERVGQKDPGIIAKFNAMPPEEQDRFMKQFPDYATNKDAKARGEKNAEDDARGKEWRGRLDEFYSWANKSPDEMAQEPEMQRMQQIVQMRAQNDSYSRGVSGGVSNLNSERAMQDALLQTSMQRKQMAGNAVGLGLNDTQGLERLREQARQFDVTGQMQADQQAYQLRAQQQALPFQIGGAVLGAVPGVATGNPMMAVSGAQAGGQIGAGAAGMFAPAPPAYNPNPGGLYTPSAPSGNKVY